MERDAAIAGRVIAAAFVARGGVAEQEGAGVHHCRAGVRPVGERPLDHGRDRELVAPLLEGAIIRTCGAEVFANAPPLPLTQRTGDQSAGGAVVSSHCPNLAILPKPANPTAPATGSPPP